MNPRHGCRDTPSTVNDMYLHFRPWIAKRTILHEYFSRSWGMFDAAERTEHSGVAAMLTGQSIELAIKAMLELVGRKPPTKHKLADCLNTVPELKSLLEQLWGADFSSLIQFVDEDINSSQMRYGAAGSHKDTRDGQEARLPDSLKSLQAAATDTARAPDQIIEDAVSTWAEGRDGFTMAQLAAGVGMAGSPEKADQRQLVLPVATTIFAGEKS